MCRPGSPYPDLTVGFDDGLEALFDLNVAEPVTTIRSGTSALLLSIGSRLPPDPRPGARG
ncbi:MAG: hypothetical protein WBP10_05180 [Thermoanaerobaculia bacterium]